MTDQLLVMEAAVARDPSSVTSQLQAAASMLDVPTTVEIATLLAQHRTQPELSSLPLATRAIFTSIRDGALHGTPPRSERTGIARVPTMGGDGDRASEPYFQKFLLEFRDRLRRHAPSNFSALATAAFEEMASNAAEHSLAVVRPIASYELSGSHWSFGVTDLGRGVLESLRSNTRYSTLALSSKALELAIQPMISCSPEPGRGTGFQVVFKALTRRRARLWFRSGSGLAVWDGRGPTVDQVKVTALPFERQGFHVRVGGPLN